MVLCLTNTQAAIAEKMQRQAVEQIVTMTEFFKAFRKSMLSMADAKFSKPIHFFGTPKISKAMSDADLNATQTSMAIGNKNTSTKKIRYMIRHIFNSELFFFITDSSYASTSALFVMVNWIILIMAMETKKMTAFACASPI